MKLMILSSHPEFEFGPFQGFVIDLCRAIHRKWSALDSVTIIAGPEDDGHYYLALELTGKSGEKGYSAHIMALASCGESEGVLMSSHYEVIEEHNCISDELDRSILCWVDGFNNLLATRDVNRLRPYQN